MAVRKKKKAVARNKRIGNLLRYSLEYTTAIFYIPKFVSENCEYVYYKASFDCSTRNFGIFTVPGYIANVKRDRINQELLTLLKANYL